MLKKDMAIMLKKHEARLAVLEELIGRYHDGELKRSPATEAAKMVERAVRYRSHALLKEVDLIYCRDLVQVMHMLHPDEPTFNTDDLDVASRRMGILLARSKVMSKLITRYSIPPCKALGVKRSNHTMNIWVIANYAEYKDVSPSVLYRQHEERWQAACTKYGESVTVADVPSFM